MFKNKLILFGLLLIFSGCGLNRAFYDPYSFAPDHPYSSYKSVAKKEQISKTYDSFLPEDFKEKRLTLAELIDVALLNNPQTKKTWSDAMAAAASYGKSMKDYLPEIDGAMSWERTRSTFINESIPDQIISGAPLNKATPYYRSTATPEMIVSYTIFDFGQRKYTTEKARQALLYADWMHNNEMQSIIELVMNSYYFYQYQRHYFMALEEDLNNAETSLDAAKQKFHTGVASLADVTQAKTSYLQSKMNLIAQKQNVVSSYATLTNILGLPSNLEIEVEDFPEEIFPQPFLENVDELITKAKEKRQDFMAMQANIKAQTANVNLAKKRYWPTINSEFDIGKNYFWPHPDEDYHFTLLFKMSIPIFYGFSLKNAVRQAEAELEKAKALSFQNELQITKDVTIAHSDMRNAADTVYYSKDYLLSAQEQYKIALANYKAGTGTILDVMSAQASLADARAKKVNSQKNWYSSIASMAYATGSLSATLDEKEKENL